LQDLLHGQDLRAIDRRAMLGCRAPHLPTPRRHTHGRLDWRRLRKAVRGSRPRR
jgi:hypothetical protein